MKRTYLAILFLLVAGLQTAWAQSVIINLKDGRSVFYSVEELDSIYFNTSNGVEEHEWVDLGLPSGTLWATMNVGAENPEEFGDYFAWGETMPSKGVDWSNYKHCQGTEWSMTKYCTNREYGFNGFTDGLTELLPEDDAASVNWGDGCQTPNMSQCYELINDAYTTKEEVWINDTRVNKITSKINGNYIILPPAGWYDSLGQYYRGGGSYWSRSLDRTESDKAFGMYFDLRILMPGIANRINCNSVRPVQKLNKEIVHVTNIVLSDTLLVLDVGDEVQLTATIEPSNATFPAVVWDNNIPYVTVSPTGKVKAYRPGTTTITCFSTDDLALRAYCRVIVRQEHDYVDLGLPSGTLWATTNIGANAPEQYGDYFAWGETEPKDTYSWGNYELCLGGYDTSLLKYICDEWHGDLGYMDNISELQPEDDAATANWGNKWQMPSSEQFYELFDDTYTTTVWTTVNGMNGRKITSKINGNSIFLPAAGLYYNSLENSGTNGYYWSNTLDYGFSCWAMSLHIYQSRYDLMSESRYEGRSVRPVRVEKVEREQHDYVDLGLPSRTLWATCNIGANSPEERGDRFAWAETETKETYEMDNYKYGDYIQMDKYCTNWEYGTSDGNTMLDLMDDAAVVNWSAEWQTPSRSQFKELIDSQYTTTEPAVQNGVNGWRITSKKNGNSIFLPSTSDDSSQNMGTYWSRNLYPFYCDMAYALIFDANNIKTYYNDRISGEFVRPVKYKDPILVSKIELNHTQLVLENAAERLTATVLPANADNDYVVWTTSDEDVAYLQDDMWVNPVSPGTCTITCRSTDGSRVYAECHITVLECHDYVNLGLPSGTLWATCNIGASKPSDYGDYFAWGETEPKSEYNWSTYFDTEDGGSTFKKYNNDGGLTELLPEDDAATANWGSVWQMPSSDQINELTNSSYTTTEWTTRNGVNGRKITSKSNGKSIFLPAAGYRNGTSLLSAGSLGNYWSRSLNTDYSDDAYGLAFYSNVIYRSSGSRDIGQSVRPVRKQ